MKYWNILQNKDLMILNKISYNRKKISSKSIKINSNKFRNKRQAVSFFTLFKNKLKLIATIINKILKIIISYYIGFII